MSSQNPPRDRAIWLGEFDVAELLGQGPEGVAKMFPLLRPDVKSEFIAQTPGVSLSYEGVDGLYEGWREWLGPWSSYVLKMRDLVEASPHEMVVMGRAEARTSRDSVVMEHRPAAVLTFDDEGLVSRVRFFIDSDDALRAAGVDGT
jgi:ketosteroid isomerase-like protein